MSVQRLKGADGVHRPLILNIPGEGFGDDALQYYFDHSLLDSTSESDFLLDQAFEASGGVCNQTMGSDSSGPPTGQQAHVPSNLEVDAAAWRKIVWTGSPIWQPQVEPDTPASSSGTLIVDGNKVDACFDESSNMARLTIAFQSASPVWAALGFMADAECLMTPRGGRDGEVILAQPSGNGEYTASHGFIAPDWKRFASVSGSPTLKNPTPLSTAAGFEGGLVEMGNGVLKLGFAREYTQRPSALHMNYAIGKSGALAYHAKRGCFSISNLTTCETSSETSYAKAKVAIGVLSAILACLHLLW